MSERPLLREVLYWLWFATAGLAALAAALAVMTAISPRYTRHWEIFVIADLPVNEWPGSNEAPKLYAFDDPNLDFWMVQTADSAASLHATIPPTLCAALAAWRAGVPVSNRRFAI